MNDDFGTGLEELDDLNDLDNYGMTGSKQPQRHVPGHMQVQPHPHHVPQLQNTSAIGAAGHAIHNVQQFLIAEDCIRQSQTNQVIHNIDRPSKTSRFSLSENPAIRIGGSDTGADSPLGTIRPHKATSTVDLKVHGRATTLKLNSTTAESWDYESVASAAGKFSWTTDVDLSLDTEDSTWKLKHKGGPVIATLKESFLTVEMPGLGQDMIDEVLVSAVGMGEAIKIQKKTEEKVAKVVLKAVLGS